MAFPIEFTKSSGSLDIFSHLINFAGNAAVVAVGGISLGAIACVALKALGFGNIVTTTVTAVLVTIGTVGAVCAVIGISCALIIASYFILMCIEFVKTMGQR